MVPLMFTSAIKVMKRPSPGSKPSALKSKAGQLAFATGGMETKWQDCPGTVEAGLGVFVGSGVGRGVRVGAAVCVCSAAISAVAVSSVGEGPQACKITTVRHRLNKTLRV